jgi:hypothetical protein
MSREPHISNLLTQDIAPQQLVEMFPKFAFRLQRHVITSDDDDAIVGNDKSTRNKGSASPSCSTTWATSTTKRLGWNESKNPCGPKVSPMCRNGPRRMALGTEARMNSARKVAHRTDDFRNRLIREAA